MGTGINGAQTNATKYWSEDDALKTSEVGTAFEYLVAKADGNVETFIKNNATVDGLNLSAGKSLELQRLMGEQSITVQTGTSSLKSVKDSISSASHNIA